MSSLSAIRTLVAVVEDEEPIRRSLTRLLRSAGLEVETFATGADFLRSLENHLPDCVLLDLHMPVMDGFEVLGRLRQTGLRVPVIITTGQDSPETLKRVMAASPVAYLCKPLDDQMLLNAIGLASQR